MLGVENRMRSEGFEQQLMGLNNRFFWQEKKEETRGNRGRLVGIGFSSAFVEMQQVWISWLQWESGSRKFVGSFLTIEHS